MSLFLIDPGWGWVKVKDEKLDSTKQSALIARKKAAGDQRVNSCVLRMWYGEGSGAGTGLNHPEGIRTNV